MQQTIQIKTDKQNGLYNIRPEVLKIVEKSKLKTGLVNVYAQGATAAIMIQKIGVIRLKMT